MYNITIIGAGLSGTLLAVNLLNAEADGGFSVKLVDPGTENDLGPAFSANEDYLLNVHAGKMGAVSNEPHHFCNWLNNKGIRVNETDFLPRKMYREYVKELFRNALNKRNRNISFERIQDEAIDIKLNENQAQIILMSGDRIRADKIVLALGNFPPRNPELKSNDYLNCPFYVQNPWNFGFINKISGEAAVFFIGTGQTTVDLACGLNRLGHKGKIFAISRHGFLPMVHKLAEPYPSFFDKLKNIKTAAELFGIIRKEIENAERTGYDIRAVIDSLRPNTPEIWMNLETEEKRKFLRHLFRYWEIIRSRIPQESGDVINKMMSTGQLTIIAGRITDMKAEEKFIEVVYKLRQSNTLKIQKADLVINCIGPELDYNKVKSTLVKNLIESGLIMPDPLNLGINALPDGRILHKDGTVSNKFFTLGLPLRGILWETLAAPEIREQAKNLSEMLLNKVN
jgi:uncharacterized NAD(P)/FAD-binding protein YdhS